MQIRIIPPFNRRKPQWAVATFIKDPIICSWKEAKRKRFTDANEARAFAKALAAKNDAELIEVAPVR